MNAFVDIVEKIFPTQEQPENLTRLASMQIGQGSSVMRADQSGFWLGAAKFADAPFKVDMDGNVTATSMTVSGYIQTGGAAADVNSGAVSIESGKISASTLSAISADLGTITAGTITGATFKTKASGVRVQMSASEAVISLYDSGDDEVLRIDDTGTIVGIASGDSRSMAVGADGILLLSGTTIVCDDDLDLDGNKVKGIDAALFDENSSRPSDSDCIWYYKSGGSYSFRTRMEGGNWSIDQSGA